MTTNKREKYLKLQNGSDIRGVSLTGVPGEPLSLREEEAKEIAIGFIIWLSDKLDKRPEDMTLAIGRDPRTSGPRLLDGLMDGFGEYGCKVYDFGYASTPAMFMATVFEDFACDGTVMITASHPANAVSMITVQSTGSNGSPVLAATSFSADLLLSGTSIVASFAPLPFESFEASSSDDLSPDGLSLSSTSSSSCSSSSRAIHTALKV